MDATPYGSIISAAASHINSLQNGLFGLAGTYLQGKQNAQLAAFQNQMNINNWKMQNEYNSPASQMKRLTEAGINPFLVAGSTGGGNAGPLPSYPSVSAPNYGDSLKDAMSFRLSSLAALMSALSQQKDMQVKDAQIENIMANTKNTEQNTLNSIWNYMVMNPLHQKKMTKDIERLGQDIILLSLQSQGQRITNDMNKYNLDYILPLERSNLSWKNRLAEYQYNYLSPAQRALMWSNVAKNKADTAFIGSKKYYQDMENMFANSHFANRFAKENKELLGLDLANYSANEHLLNQIIENNYLHDLGTTSPGNLKLGPLPIGAFSRGLLSPFKRYRNSFINRKYNKKY